MNRRTSQGATIAILLILLIAGLIVSRNGAGPASPSVPVYPPPDSANQFVTPTAYRPFGGGPAGNPGIGTGNTTVRNPGGGLPNLASKPQPQDPNYQGCPAQGDGGDPELNIRKNRVDSAPWYPVTIQSVLNLKWPQTIERQQRANWAAADRAAVAQYEGIPVQVEGWLAGAKEEGPESCNCHSPDDVDNHLWIVDTPNKDRSQSMVIEVTPRVRALNPGWAFDRIRPLVDGKTRVRISGWLMMDQEHPDQVGKTRGTIWEIHPIIAFDYQQGNQWLSLNTGHVSTTQAAQGNPAPPTEDPSLPPPIVETPGPDFLPTATPRPPKGTAGGQSTGGGPVQIADIFANGAKSGEPDEYVEIANQGSAPVSLDGWALHDVYGGQTFTWHGFSLAPGQHIRVYTNETHPESGGFSFQSRQAIWNNKGDAAELLDAQGNVVSTFAYGNRK